MPRMLAYRARVARIGAEIPVLVQMRAYAHIFEIRPVDVLVNSIYLCYNRPTRPRACACLYNPPETYGDVIRKNVMKRIVGTVS